MSHYAEERDAWDRECREQYNKRHAKEIQQLARKLNRRKQLYKELTEKYPELIEYLDLCNELK